MDPRAVTNQAPPLEPYNLFTTDPVLGDAVEGEGGHDDLDLLSNFGELVGSERVMRWGHDANRNPPELVTHDRFGNRIDEVNYHPSYHELMELSVSEGLHCLHYERPPGEAGYITRNALFYLMSQAEAGHGCPISMTSSVLPALRHQPELAGVWEPKIVSRTYDPRLISAEDKPGCLLGMGMTEKQGGSDVRSNTTVAVSTNGRGPGSEYRLTGHKWFTSAPMSDAFLVLGQAPGGLSCFVVPRVLPDGTRNPIMILRLKEKLGNRSNASAEIELADTAGWMIGDEGRGVRTIIEMVNGTRVDCVVGSAALMRQAVTQAGWHVANRMAFGAPLIDKPLMQNVIADLEIEVEAATLMMVRLAGAHDRAAADPTEAAFARIATPVAKYWVTKRCSTVVREALECLGGNGYVEESILPRLYREAPVNAIWEGSGNVIALDVLRAMARSPHGLEAFLAELERASGSDRVLDRALDRLHETIAGLAETDAEAEARRLTEQMAVAWAAFLLVTRGDEAVADAFIMSRLDGDWGIQFGTLPPAADLESIALRAVPVA
jgi:putative acyl-CoA dehydrogenase